PRGRPPHRPLLPADPHPPPLRKTARTIKPWNFKRLPHPPRRVQSLGIGENKRRLENQKTHGANTRRHRARTRNPPRRAEILRDGVRSYCGACAETAGISDAVRRPGLLSVSTSFLMAEH